MSEKKISYLSRNFDDYKDSLVEFTKKYYPNVAENLNDASIGSWLIDMVAAVSDNLSYHIDRVYNETNIETAQERGSIYALARSNGFKIPGPKGAMTEVKFSCHLPVYVIKNNNDNSTTSTPNWRFAPVIKKGTKLSSGNHIFEVMEDIDFKEQFDNNGISNRQIIPKKNSNGVINIYEVTKTVTVIAGESKVYKQVMNTNSIKPFMEILIPDRNVMNIESIIFKNGGDYKTIPHNNEFYMNSEYISAEDNPYGTETRRFFEVNSLLEQYRWGDEINNNVEGNQVTSHSNKVTYGYMYSDANINTPIPTTVITKGQWYPLTQKFITEYTDKGYLKVIFGSGKPAGQVVDIDEGSDFTKSQISRMINNDAMGVLPPNSGNWTMYIKYRVGGGTSSNIAAGALTNIVYLDAEVGTCIYTLDEHKISNAVRNSITVTNTIPSVSGKDIPTIEELRNMIKYSNAAQERCVTLKDYENRVLMMPPKYGCPFRVSATEENNKIMLYLIGLDNNGYFTPTMPEQMIKNIINYLSMYRSLNDFVEIKSGRIINISFEVDVFVDKNYNPGDVVKNIINTIKDYMDIKKRYIGEDIFVGDIQKEVSKVDGVLNLIDLRVYNEYGKNYSMVMTPQQIKQVGEYSDKEEGRDEIDLSASDYILITESDSIFELKFPETDIKVRVKTR
jgi:hypothetical protein